MSWVFLVLFYGVAKGARDVIKKKALTRNTVMEVLFVYTFLAFLCCIPEFPQATGGMPTKYYFLIGIKSFVIFLAWIFSFKAIDSVPISIYGVLDLSRILFSTAFGVFVLHETIGLNQAIGFTLVLTGLIALKVYPAVAMSSKEAVAEKGAVSRKKSFEKEDVRTKYILMILASCLLNAVSGCLDKVYTKDINPSQLQFWYMLYLVIFYGLYFVVTRTKISRSVFKNGWIYLMSFIFFLADRALFVANQNPASKVTVMTLIKQSSCIVAIAAGKFIFKEKNIGYKLFCAFIIIVGIVVSVC